MTALDVIETVSTASFHREAITGEQKENMTKSPNTSISPSKTGSKFERVLSACGQLFELVIEDQKWHSISTGPVVFHIIRDHAENCFRFLANPAVTTGKRKFSMSKITAGWTLSAASKKFVTVQLGDDDSTYGVGFSRARDAQEFYDQMKWLDNVLREEESAGSVSEKMDHGLNSFATPVAKIHEVVRAGPQSFDRFTTPMRLLPGLRDVCRVEPKPVDALPGRNVFHGQPIGAGVQVQSHPPCVNLFGGPGGREFIEPPQEMSSLPMPRHPQPAHLGVGVDINQNRQNMTQMGVGVDQTGFRPNAGFPGERQIPQPIGAQRRRSDGDVPFHGRLFPNGNRKLSDHHDSTLTEDFRQSVDMLMASYGFPGALRYVQNGNNERVRRLSAVMEASNNNNAPSAATVPFEVFESQRTSSFGGHDELEHLPRSREFLGEQMDRVPGRQMSHFFGNGVSAAGVDCTSATGFLPHFINRPIAQSTPLNSTQSLYSGSVHGETAGDLVPFFSPAEASRHYHQALGEVRGNLESSQNSCSPRPPITPQGFDRNATVGAFPFAGPPTLHVTFENSSTYVDVGKQDEVNQPLDSTLVNGEEECELRSADDASMDDLIVAFEPLGLDNSVLHNKRKMMNETLGVSSD